MTVQSVQQAKEAGIVFEPRAVANGFEVQILRYEPCMRAQKNTAEPLSVWLSLRDFHDVRVQLALGEIGEKFLW